ncbi:MAG: endonuclease/exonuclease/phosphatase family protein [Isosphaeraceae bacterium]|nr:endonuclease/exonuclease/phosphatase family protein [Isosphaeraceae bacterium]
MRILSWNIHKGIGGRDRRYDLGRIIEVVESESPDIVCLQEVDRNVARSNHEDQSRAIPERLGLAESIYQFNHRVKSGGYGNLVASRWGFLEVHQISLRIRRRKNRGAQLVTITTPRGPLLVVNWHLGLLEQERRRQVELLFEHRGFRRRLSTPTIVIGDTNDWRNTFARGPLTRHGLRALTEPSRGFRSFPAARPLLSIDKAFACPRVSVDAVRIPRTPATREASDHLPLVVDFDL